MIPRDYQVTIAMETIAILRANGLAYIAAEERTGKTLAAVLVGEMYSKKPMDILVLTKKKALDGWKDTLKAYGPDNNFIVTNYHSAWKLIGDYDMVILDEAHNYISSFPKIGSTAEQRKVMAKEGKNNVNIYDAVRRLCRRLPVVFMSATPHAQGPQQLYHQFSCSTYSPFRRFDTFYSWFKHYGEPYTLEFNGVQANQYDKCKVDKILDDVKHLFVTKTRRELGFAHEPKDVKHYIELDKDTRAVYNWLLADNIIEIKAGTLVCDTASKLRAALHMMEGGVAKIDKEPIVLANDEKVRYILETFGDREDLVIMYNFQAELTKLSATFKKATILQATSFAEGVDLHKYSDLVIYSQDYSTARHTQRRARQCNMNRDTPINVNHILVKNAISEQVFKCVCENKKNYVDSVFKRTKL